MCVCVLLFKETYLIMRVVLESEISTLLMNDYTMFNFVNICEFYSVKAVLRLIELTPGKCDLCHPYIMLNIKGFVNDGFVDIFTLFNCFYSQERS